MNNNADEDDILNDDDPLNLSHDEDETLDSIGLYDGDESSPETNLQPKANIDYSEKVVVEQKKQKAVDVKFQIKQCTITQPLPEEDIVIYILEESKYKLLDQVQTEVRPAKFITSNNNKYFFLEMTEDCPMKDVHIDENRKKYYVEASYCLISNKRDKWYHSCKGECGQEIEFKLRISHSAPADKKEPCKQLRKSLLEHFSTHSNQCKEQEEKPKGRKKESKTLTRDMTGDYDKALLNKNVKFLKEQRIDALTKLRSPFNASHWCLWGHKEFCENKFLCIGQDSQTCIRFFFALLYNSLLVNQKSNTSMESFKSLEKQWPFITNHLELEPVKFVVHFVGKENAFDIKIKVVDRDGNDDIIEMDEYFDVSEAEERQRRKSIHLIGEMISNICAVSEEPKDCYLKEGQSQQESFDNKSREMDEESERVENKGSAKKKVKKDFEMKECEITIPTDRFEGIILNMNLTDQNMLMNKHFHILNIIPESGSSQKHDERLLKNVWMQKGHNFINIHVMNAEGNAEMLKFQKSFEALGNKWWKNYREEVSNLEKKLNHVYLQKKFALDSDGRDKWKEDNLRYFSCSLDGLVTHLREPICDWLSTQARLLGDRHLSHKIHYFNTLVPILENEEKQSFACDSKLLEILDQARKVAQRETLKSLDLVNYPSDSPLWDIAKTVIVNYFFKQLKNETRNIAGEECIRNTLEPDVNAWIETTTISSKAELYELIPNLIKEINSDKLSSHFKEQATIRRKQAYQYLKTLYDTDISEGLKKRRQ